MRKKALAALLFSIFGMSAALADRPGCERDDCAWYGWWDCRPCEESDPEDPMGVDYWFGACGMCGGAYCVDFGTIKSGRKPSLVMQKAKEIIKKIEPENLNLRGDDVLKIALEITDKNPRAAGVLFGMYTLANRPSVSFPQEGVIWGHGDPIDSPLTAEKAKRFIQEYHKNGKYNKENYADENSEIKYQYDWYLRETANGAAYIVIKIAAVDKNKREIEKILPNIRINLRPGKDGRGEYWEPIGWQAD